MSLQGVPARSLLAIPGRGGAYLVDLRTLPPEVQRVLEGLADSVHARIEALHRATDFALIQMGASFGFVNLVGLSGSTQEALNFGKYGMPVAGSTQFTWSFGATEPDAGYGIQLTLNGPNTMPTIMKFTDRVRVDFGAVTPAGLKADLLLYR